MTSIKTLQIASDIHLELRGKKINYDALLQPCASYLVLAGDIGRPFYEVSGGIRHYKAFLGYCSSQWEKVFVVTGNHSYYGRTKEEIDAEVQQICKDLSNVYFLNDSYIPFTYEQSPLFCGIYGCTYWTEVTDYTFSLMNDRTIRKSGSYKKGVSKNITAQNIRQWHKEHKDKLESFLSSLYSKKDGRKVILVTHHPISTAMQDDISIYSSAYFNELAPFITADKVGLSISGHTHKSKDIMVDGIRMISNCMGYPNQTKRETLYAPDSPIISLY